MRTPTVILFLLCALLTSCNSYNQVNVSVATQSGTPVAGASVHASPMYFFNPTNKNYIFIGPYDILEPFPAKGDASVTDEFGNVQLHIVTKSPLDLRIYAENFDPWNGQISITKHGDAEVTPFTNQSKLDVSIVGSVQ